MRPSQVTGSPGPSFAGEVPGAHHEDEGREGHEHANDNDGQHSVDALPANRPTCQIPSWPMPRAAFGFLLVERGALTGL